MNLAMSGIPLSEGCPHLERRLESRRGWRLRYRIDRGYAAERRKVIRLCKEEIFAVVLSGIEHILELRIIRSVHSISDKSPLPVVKQTYDIFPENDCKKRAARHLSDTGRLVVPAGHDPATP